MAATFKLYNVDLYACIQSPASHLFLARVVSDSLPTNLSFSSFVMHPAPPPNYAARLAMEDWQVVITFDVVSWMLSGILWMILSWMLRAICKKLKTHRERRAKVAGGAK